MLVGGVAGLFDRAAAQRGLGTTALLALRITIALPFFFALAAYFGELRPAFRTDAATLGWVALSAITGSLTLALYFAATRVGEATGVFPIAGSWPAVTALLAIVLLGERPSAMRLVGIALTLAGVALLGRSA